VLYLFAAIICSSSIAVLFKVSDRRGCKPHAVTVSNYFVASAAALAAAAVSGRPDAGAGWAALSGIGGGVFYLLGFVFYQKCVSTCGVGISGSAIKLGILVPLLVSLLAWSEVPNAVQWCGIALGLAAILALAGPGEGGRGFAPLVLLFLFGGIAEFSNKLFQKFSSPGTESLFLFFVFSTALALSGAILLAGRVRPDRGSLLMGLAVGVPNMLASRFLLEALGMLPAPAVFAAYSSGSILLTSLAGILLFREHPSPRMLASILLTALSLLLISLGSG
jgi:drug/metabolite transporter (DMT)-like permease